MPVQANERRLGRHHDDTSPSGLQHVFRGDCHVKLGAGRTRVEGLGSCSGRSRRPPILKRFASESAERIAGNEMALDVECVLDCGMDGQEPLR